MTREIRTFGLAEEHLRHRLADLLQEGSEAVTLSFCGGHGTVAVADDDALVEEINLRLTGYAYTDRGESLAARVVGLLTDHGLTVATAESCTGGLIAAALTDVPGASRVFGTGVVSYSNDCKQALLSVSADTLSAVGAVSADTAGQMARGVRRTARSAIGVAVTGEAGPVAAEDCPVGTVFVALADSKRTWVEPLHLEGDRAAIRRQAADGVLWLLWRYLCYYPAVMAGGESHRHTGGRTIPRTQGSGQPHLLTKLLPWRGDTPLRITMKTVAWLSAIALLVTGGWMGYRILNGPVRNRELQDSLGDIYYESTDLTEGATAPSQYPEGMMTTFRGLYDMNEDVGGWLHIPDSDVDYPVMNYTDGFYRNHSFLGEYSLYGQPYFERVESARFYVIHGRNAEDGQMFSHLLNCRRIAYLREHAVMEMDTLFTTGRWQVVAVTVTDDDEADGFSLPAEDFQTDEEYLTYLSALQQHSLFTVDSPLTADDTLLFLTTDADGEYGFDGARFTVVARRMTDDTTVGYGVNYDVEMPSEYEMGER